MRRVVGNDAVTRQAVAEVAHDDEVRAIPPILRPADMLHAVAKVSERHDRSHEVWGH